MDSDMAGTLMVSSAAVPGRTETEGQSFIETEGAGVGAGFTKVQTGRRKGASQAKGAGHDQSKSIFHW